MSRPPYMSPFGYGQRNNFGGGLGGILSSLFSGGGFGNLFSMIGNLFSGNSFSSGNPYAGNSWSPSYTPSSASNYDSGFRDPVDPYMAPTGSNSFPPASLPPAALNNDVGTVPVIPPATGVVPSDYTPPAPVLPHATRGDTAHGGDDGHNHGDDEIPPATTAPRDPRQTAIQTRPDSLTAEESRRIGNWTRAQIGMQNTPIWRPFYSRFKACRPDCEPIEYNVHRNGGGRSCHHSDRAIDVFGFRCRDGSTHRAIQSSANSGPFADLVNCMVGPGRAPGTSSVRGSRQIGLYALWHNGSDVTQGHKNHGHFSIGCGGFY